MSTEAVASPQLVLQQLKWRYATKQFDPSKKIPDDIWHALEQSLVLTPSSFGMQPWKFIVVRNPETRQALLAHSWKQTQVVDASHLVVLAIKKNMNDSDVDRYLARTATVQGAPLESLEGFGKIIKGFMANPKMDVDGWATRQVYIALGQLMVAAAMLGVDACPMEGIVPPKYDEVLGLADQGYAAVLACPVGYRAADDKYAAKPKVRFETAEVIQYVD
jgi:nitroreductase